MRRLVIVLAVCMLGLPLLPADAAVIRGTNLNSATSPVSLLAGLNCTPSVSDMALTDDPPANDNRMPYEYPEVPATPVPELTPELGSRYLQYVGAPQIGRGPSVHFAPGDNPTAASIRVAAPTGQSYVVPFIVGFGAGLPSDSAQIYLGIGATPKRVGPTWSTATMDFSTVGAMDWFRWDNGWTAQGPAWSAGPNVVAPRPGWEYQVGFLVGCGTSTPVDVDQLSVTSTRSGTRTFDFEALPSAVSAMASAATVKAGRAVTISASATQNGVPAAVPLRVVRCRTVTCQYVDDTAVTSSTAGMVHFTVRPQAGWTYGVRYDGDGNFGPAQANVAVGVAPYLVVRLGQRTVHLGDTVAVGGQLAPCVRSKRRLVIQRWVHRSWRKVGRASAPRCRHGQRSATVRGSFRARTLGAWKVRVVAPPQHGYARASRTLRLTVTKRPVRHVAAAPVVAQPHLPTQPTTTHTTVAPPPPPI